MDFKKGTVLVPSALHTRSTYETQGPARMVFPARVKTRSSHDPLLHISTERLRMDDGE